MFKADGHAAIVANANGGFHMEMGSTRFGGFFTEITVHAIDLSNQMHQHFVGLLGVQLVIRIARAGHSDKGGDPTRVRGRQG